MELNHDSNALTSSKSHKKYSPMVTKILSYLASTYHVGEYWLIVIRTLEKNQICDLKQNPQIFFQQNAFDYVVCKSSMLEFYVYTIVPHVQNRHRQYSLCPITLGKQDICKIHYG